MGSNTIKAQPIIIHKVKPQLQKAKLIAYDNEAKDIELMFNPTEISFTRTVKWENQPGNRGSTLLPKINFSGVEPYKFTLKQLLFDTYEMKESVMDKYINKIKLGVEPIGSSQNNSSTNGSINNTNNDRRPPVYKFTWGQEYFHCVITSLTYTLTMFLTDGTPVRAMVDISLQEVDKKNPPGDRQTNQKGSNRPQDPRIRSPR
ncbi:MAG: hypothetical protein KME38_16760 [Spirirestis rafaelensis WJT71-NPBG6]|jgi:hypothetical protein|nr:hypothetical protein [Spirirestis rafaelensis WJT71-NPBG6]